MKPIIIHGTSLTPDQARVFLKELKICYEEGKEYRAFPFNGHIILTDYAKYLIEYLENCLNEKS